MGKLFIYVFVILNSVSGLQMAGVSINIIFVGMFVAFSDIEYLKYRNDQVLKVLTFWICIVYDM